MDAVVARQRIVHGLARWVSLDPDLARCIDDRDVDYSQVDYSPLRVRVPENMLFQMTEDGPWAPFLDGSSPWLHANLVMTTDGRPIVTLRMQSFENGRQPSGTYSEIDVNVSFQNQSVAEVVPKA